MWQKCPICNGMGYASDPTGLYSNTTCPVCNGTKIINELTGLPPEKKIVTTTQNAYIIDMVERKRSLHGEVEG